MFPDRDFDPQAPLPGNAQDLTRDFGLDILFEAMSDGDDTIHPLVQKAVFSSLSDLEAIRYRQEVLRDCLRNPEVVREIYRLGGEAVERKRKGWYGFFGQFPSSILHGAVATVEMFTELLEKLRKIAEDRSEDFRSEGFSGFFRRIRRELDDRYLHEVRERLTELKFREGMVLSARLGKGNEAAGYFLCKPGRERRSWWSRIFSPQGSVHSFSVHPRDEAGAKALARMRDRGIVGVANALAQAADHIDGFFQRLRTELAFYVGGVNLYERLAALGAPISFPTPLPPRERKQIAKGLYDVCLALVKKEAVIGNDLQADDKDLVIITGANQGGKSTFLRSVGLAQLMLQCGLYVPAESFTAPLCNGLFTHYKREEDASMKSGKLDEELGRMSVLVDRLRPDALMLFNESFAATNEREGSEIARHIVQALVERGVRVFYVTHQYAFASHFCENKRGNVLFLRAERKEDGARTFRLIEGEPLPTSFGADLYESLFEEGG